jgi:hypothetical protein
MECIIPVISKHINVLSNRIILLKTLLRVLLLKVVRVHPLDSFHCVALGQRKWNAMDKLSCIIAGTSCELLALQ